MWITGQSFLNVAGIVLLIVAWSGQQGNEPNQKLQKLIHVVNTLERDDTEISQL